MRTLTLLILLLFTGVSYALTPTEEPAVVVLHIDGLTQQENIQIHKLFYSDSNYEVINSCQILGLVVIRNQENSISSKVEAQAYIQQKMESISLRSPLAFIENKSSMEVSHQCRAKVAEQQQNK